MKATIGPGNAKELEEQINSYIAKYEPKHQPLIRALRRTLRRRFPTAQELVYDYSKFFVIGYSATQRGSDSIVALAAGADGVKLYFSYLAKLPDPKKILLGSGKQTRYIRVESDKVLARPEVKALLTAASARAKFPLEKTGSGNVVIKSNSAIRKTRRRPKSAKRNPK